MLKSDLHIHTKGDPEDLHIKYGPKEVIRKAAKLGFNVLSITHHNRIFFNSDVKKFAKNKGILLIKGVEASVEGKHVLVYGSDSVPKTFSSLEKLHDNNCLVMAPHPFYPWKTCLHKKLEENINLFDALEYSFFYIPLFNPFNKRAVSFAQKHRKAVVGTSDLHDLRAFGYTYSLVDSNPDQDSFFEAIRKRKVKHCSRQVPLSLIFSSAWKQIIHDKPF